MPLTPDLVWRALRDGEQGKVAGDTRFRLLGIMAIPVYLLAMYVPFSQQFFELAPLGLIDWCWVALVSGVGYVLSILSDRLLAERRS